MGSRILVTGGCGFVGKNLINKLLDEKSKSNIVIVDNLATSTSPRDWLNYDGLYNDTNAQYDEVYECGSNKVMFNNQDVRDYFKEKRGVSFDDVFHLAAIVGGRETISGEPLTVASDLSIDAEFFNWAVETSPDNILYASSSAAYPTHLQNGEDVRKLKEDDIDFKKNIGVPDMTYGWSKLTGEYMCKMAVENYGLSVAIVRPFSGYGEDQNLTYPIPAIAKRAADNEDPLTIWGSGKQVRDFIHIEDAVEGMISAIAMISDGSSVNLGTGKPTDFYEVAELFSKISGYNPEITNLPEKPEGPKYRCANTKKMEKTLDWNPSISIKEGFERVYESVNEEYN
jgi:nucleoside-diphosphate-sugar epimerase